MAGLLWGVVSNRHAIGTKLFGPPAVDSVEAYGETESELTFDYSVFDRLLSEFVDDAGWVDYEGLKNRQGELQVGTLADAPFDELEWAFKLLLLVVSLLVAANFIGQRMILFPPLVVIASEMFAHTSACPWARTPWRLPIACAATAFTGVLAVKHSEVTS